MKKIVVILICILYTAILHAQKKTVLEEYENCYFNSFPDKGVKIKELFDEYEELLVNEKVLADTSAESYFELFKKMFRGEQIKPIKFYSFADSVTNLEYPENLVHFNSKCTKQAMNREDFKDSKIYKNEKRQDSINKLPLPYNQRVEKILELFSKEDFASQFRKLRVLLEVELNMEPPIEMNPLKEEIPITEVDKAFKIVMNADNEIEILTNTYGTADLKLSLKKYLKDNKEDAVVDLKVSRGTLYKNYLELQNLIFAAYQEVRNEYSLKTFEIKYDDLTEQDQKKVDSIYPIRIIDYE